MEANFQTTRILVVSREMATLRPLWSVIESNCWLLETMTTGWEALERLQSGVAPHLLVLDLSRGDTDSLHILRWIHRLRPELPILLLCNPEDAALKNDAIRMGADDVLVKPCTNQELELAISKHLLGSSHAAEREAMADNVEAIGQDGFFVSTSPVMRKVRSQAELLAEVDVPVLIVGETGSGKEAVARLIHRLSVRSGFLFLKVNCAAVPGDLLEKEIFGVEKSQSPGKPVAGKIEIAAKGILLVAEIDAMPTDVQTQLLNVLYNAHYKRVGGDHILTAHSRILISTSTNIEQAVVEKRIREELYYRAGAFTVRVPPLRQRREEIPLLLRHFMYKLAKHYGFPTRDFSASLIEACQNYSWPGNLRELETFAKRYLVTGDEESALHEIRLNHAGESRAIGEAPGTWSRPLASGAEAGNSTPLKSLLQSLKSETEKTAIAQALQKTNWNRKAAARLLRVSYRTLLYKIEQYHMHATAPFSSAIEGVHSGAGGAGQKPKITRG